MSAAVTFLLFWFGFVVVGIVVTIIFRLDLSTVATVNIGAWLRHDIIYILIISWLLAAAVILYLYTKSTGKKDEEKEESKDGEVAKNKEEKNVSEERKESSEPNEATATE